jgi:hypothetical protein
LIELSVKRKLLDKSEKRARKKWLILLGPIIFLPLIGAILGWYTAFQANARESYVRLTGKAINTAEESYHEVWKTYSASLKDIGFSTEVKDIVFYTTKEDIPENDLKKIHPENYPFFETDKYQMIIKWTRKTSGEESFWVLDENGIAKKIEK